MRALRRAVKINKLEIVSNVPLVLEHDYSEVRPEFWLRLFGLVTVGLGLRILWPWTKITASNIMS